MRKDLFAMDIPVQTIQLRIDTIKPREGEWKEKELDILHELLVDKTFNVIIEDSEVSLFIKAASCLILPSRRTGTTMLGIYWMLMETTSERSYSPDSVNVSSEVIYYIQLLIVRNVCEYFFSLIQK